MERRAGAKAWWVVAAVAWIVRLVYLGQIHTAPQSHLLMGDAEAYDQWARQIVAGDWLGSTVFYQSPFYPYFLAGIYACGGGTTAVKIVQTMLGAAACVLLGRAAEHWFDRRTGLLAAWLLALNPTAIFFDGLIQKGAPETFLTALFLLLFARSVAPLKRGRINRRSRAMCRSFRTIYRRLSITVWALRRSCIYDPALLSGK